MFGAGGPGRTDTAGGGGGGRPELHRTDTGRSRTRSSSALQQQNGRSRREYCAASTVSSPLSIYPKECIVKQINRVARVPADDEPRHGERAREKRSIASAAKHDRRDRQRIDEQRHRIVVAAPHALGATHRGNSGERQYQKGHSQATLRLADRLVICGGEEMCGRDPDQKGRQPSDRGECQQPFKE